MERGARSARPVPFQDKKDTLFRIHGTNEPNSIGKAVVRMHPDDGRRRDRSLRPGREGNARRRALRRIWSARSLSSASSPRSPWTYGSGSCRRPGSRRGVGAWSGVGWPGSRVGSSFIGRLPPVRGHTEVGIGWAFHYAVGIAYAALICNHEAGLRTKPALGSALLYSIALLVTPWFVMQPALGLGFMAARTPKPEAVRAVNISVHAAFGLGLYLGAVAGASPRPRLSPP